MELATIGHAHLPTKRTGLLSIHQYIRHCVLGAWGVEIVMEGTSPPGQTALNPHDPQKGYGPPATHACKQTYGHSICLAIWPLEQCEGDKY